MRRFIFVTAATILGLVLLLTYRSGSTRLAAVGPVSSSNSGSSSNSATGPAPNKSTTGTSTGTHNVDGPSIDTPFGAVQVRISVSGHKIVNIVTLQLPSDRQYSQQVSAYSGPMLIQEAMAAQSPSINAISGATYTSDGFAQSLQGAMQQAGLA